MEKKTIKAKLETFTFLRKSAESQGYKILFLDGKEDK